MTLQTIAVEQLRLGMFIVELECSWLDSPFWRRRFTVDDLSVVDRLKSAGVAQVTIDLSRGCGPIAGPHPGSDTSAFDAEPQPDPVPVIIERRSAARRLSSPRTETERARETVERSKVAVTRMFGEARLGRAVEVEAVAPLVDEIAQSMARDRSAMLNVTRLKTKNEYTYLHSVAVCALMINLARQLGIDEAEVQQIGIAGLLHDIGKMGVPADVLEKPGKLDEGEVRVIRSHPEKGHRLLSDSADISAIALDVCLHHHERVDGRGYPFGLTADQLSLHARMGAICDVYDAVTSERPYKKPWSANEALARMAEWEGHFDPEILDAFIASIGIHPRDALVRLHSNRLGIVLPDADNPTVPQVRVFYEVAEDRFIAPIDIATDNRTGDPIIRSERGDRWFGADWPQVLADTKAGRPSACATLAARIAGVAA